jgi:predicted metalloprotease with PDZ domain
MSRNVLGVYKNQYGNVYQKGALITMCLDIKLLQLSNGKYGFLNLIHDLSNKYGKQKGFKDDDLFSEIEKLTYPEIKQFLNDYVGGNQSLPYEEILNVVGVNYKAQVETKDSIFSMGRVSMQITPEGKLIVDDTSRMNTLGKALGYHLSDEITSINGEEFSIAKANKFFQHFGASSRSGDSLIIKVLRKDAGGNNTPVVLRSIMTKFPIMKYNALEFSNNPSPQQLMLRNAWLKPRADVDQL